MNYSKKEREDKMTRLFGRGSPESELGPEAPQPEGAIPPKETETKQEPTGTPEKELEIKLIPSERIEEQPYKESRKATQITLARIEEYRDLWAETKQEGNEKFIQKTKELWKEFVVHGVVGKDEKTGEQIILNYTDLDGKSCLGLLELAGINIENVEYVAPSKHVKGKINLDTGDRHGLIVEDEGKTAFLDHHSDESGRDSSAAKFTYQTLISLGLLKREEYLDKIVEFVTQVDNRTYPDGERYFGNSWQTVLGLQRFIQFKHLINFFKAGRSPTETLSDDDLKKMGLKERATEQKKITESSLSRLEEMGQEGLIVQSERYGNIAIDIGKKVWAGFDAAKAYGCGGYIIWNPEQNSFFISTAQPLTDEFKQGIKVRKTMWIKPLHDKTPLTITLSGILEKMTDGKIQPSGKLKEYLKTERIAEKPPAEPQVPEEKGEDVQIDIAVPKKLAEEILPTTEYLHSYYLQNEEYQKFIRHRSDDRIAKLLNPDRPKTAGDMQEIDQLVEQKIQAGEAENRDQALKILYREHLYGPPLPQKVSNLIRGLRGGKPIDISFLEQQLWSRREHQEGQLGGEPPHWTKEKPPTEKQKRGFRKEMDKMDRFLDQLGQV